MVALTDAQWQQLVILTIGDEVTTAYPIGVLLANQALWWGKNDELSYDPELRYLYAKRDAAGIVLGAVRDQVDKTVGPLRIAYAKRGDTLRAMIAATTIEIDERFRQNAADGPVVGIITVTAPAAPPFPYTPDANDSQYIGDVYKPLTTPQ